MADPHAVPDDPLHDHSRPDQAEEPVDDIGASNVDSDEARHGAAHESPAAPEAGHEPAAPHDDLAHDAPRHDDHGDHDDDSDHPVENPGWVLAPLVVGVIIAIVIIVLVGLQSGASPARNL